MGIAKKLDYEPNHESRSGQETGRRFETLTGEFIEQSLRLIYHLRPGEWRYIRESSIGNYKQYEHLAALDNLIKQHTELASSLGIDYLITPDIVIARLSENDEIINAHGMVISTGDHVAQLTPMRSSNSTSFNTFLHASISCKWTLRSDRAQNARTEALNLIRNRKGRVPHIVCVTAEPLPTRIASLALGTGDLDCVYHFALYELQETLEEIQNVDQLDLLQTLVEGQRLRDISDLPFDLLL